MRQLGLCFPCPFLDSGLTEKNSQLPKSKGPITKFR